MFLLSITFMMGTFFLTAVSSALRRTNKRDLHKLLQSLGGAFFYRPIHLFFLPEHEYEGIFFATTCAQNITRFCSTVAMLVFLIFRFNILPLTGGVEAPIYTSWIWFWLSMFAFILVSFFFGDCLPRILGSRYPHFALRFSTPFASLFLLLVFPLTYIYLKVAMSLSRTSYFDLAYEPMASTQHEIIEMIQKADLQDALDAHDKKLIESVMRFKERIAREVMVPRVNVFSLPAETTIKEAARLLEKEGYSRTPVYRNTVDNIIGVLMYKDILNKYQMYEQSGNNLAILDAPIETILKSVLHTPETKKISSLLQEFRKKQVHLAIVVDEYGGTEGIVTIEDILEEIVGEISDEYDQESELFFAQPDGTWIVDARMNTVDAEEQLGVEFPDEGDYDTIGGYIFHTAGSIPSKGFVIHHDTFDMEILQSNDRSVGKVRIKPIKTKEE